MKSWDTKLFFAVIGIVIVFLLALPFSSTIQRLMMNKFHLQSPSFATWSILQFVPSMYNFQNEIIVTEKIGGTVVLQEWVNHYPFRLITFTPSAREFFATRSQDYRMILRSRYLRTDVETIYDIRARSGRLDFEKITP